MKTDFLLALRQIEREREIPPEEVRSIVEDALARAFQAESEGLQSLRVEFDPEEGSIAIYRVMEVVRKVENEALEISVEGAKEIVPDAEVGDLVEKEIPLDTFRRIGIQQVKHFIIQRIREIERNAQLERYVDRVGEIVTGTIARVNNQGVTVNLGRIDGVIPASEKVPGERYALGKRIKVYIQEVKQGLKDSEIIISRGSPEFVRKLFQMEVPEISQGIVQIKAIVREPGYRTKMAVISNQDKVDPVGACVGHKGQRVKNIVNELSGEKIDIIPWNDSPAQFIASALSPAQVISVEIFEEEHSAQIIVPDNQLSLAIGKAGQNARLANKLTSWKIDILSEEEKDKLERELRSAKLLENEIASLGISTRVANILNENGIQNVGDLVRKTYSQLGEIQGLGEKSLEEIVERLNSFNFALTADETPVSENATETEGESEQ
ncbi:MAG: transcription termination factor NusA [bacterium]